MLRAHDLWFRYGRRLPWVVRAARLEVAPGEVVGLHGPSGTGKSTLGRLLAGHLHPHSGTVEIGGAPAPRRGPHPVQLVLQHPDQAMDPRWTVRKVLAEADPDGTLHPDLVSPAWLDRYPHELSGGELQRVNLARALLARPGFLVADEITASLDALTQARLWHLLTAHAKESGTGVLAVSHDLPLLEAVCDRVLEWSDLAQGEKTPS